MFNGTVVPMRAGSVTIRMSPSWYGLCRDPWYQYPWSHLAQYSDHTGTVWLLAEGQLAEVLVEPGPDGPRHVIVCPGHADAHTLCTLSSDEVDVWRLRDHLLDLLHMPIDYGHRSCVEAIRVLRPEDGGTEVVVLVTVAAGLLVDDPLLLLTEDGRTSPGQPPPQTWEVDSVDWLLEHLSLIRQGDRPPEARDQDGDE